MAEIVKLKQCRAYTKGTITSDLKRLDKFLKPDDAGAAISKSLALSIIANVENKLTTVDEFTEPICLELGEQEMLAEIEQNSDYTFDVRAKVSQFKDLFPENPSKVGHVNEASVKLPLPTISLDSFQNNHKYPFAYFTFRKAFLNALAGIPNVTNAQKLIYLRNFVKGEALNVIEGIAVDDSGFKAAFDLLDFHFLNKDEIKDRTLDSILTSDVARFP